MKISLIAPTYLPSRRANTIQVMKMAQAMTELGNEIRVFVPGPHPEMAWGEIARVYGLQKQFELVWLPANPIFRRYDYGFSSVKHSLKWGADLIFTRLPQAAAVAGLLGPPIILEVHDLPQGTLGPCLFRRFLKGKKARRLVVITLALKNAINQVIAELPPEPFTLIASDGVDLTRYEDLPSSPQARKDLNLPDNFTVGYTGHLYAGRGASIIIEIASHLPEVIFLLVGGNPSDVDDVRNQAKERGLANVILTGFIPNADLPQYQAACDVLLMPYQETVLASSGGDIARFLSPMKLFEYLACGRGIISSNLPVLQEVLNAQNAILLPPDEVLLWVDSIRKLNENPEQLQSLAEQSRKDSIQYSWKQRAGNILEGLS